MTLFIDEIDTIIKQMIPNENLSSCDEKQVLTTFHRIGTVVGTKAEARFAESPNQGEKTHGIKRSNGIGQGKQSMQNGIFHPHLRLLHWSCCQ